MPHPASYRAALRAVLGLAMTVLAVLLPAVVPAIAAAGAAAGATTGAPARVTAGATAGAAETEPLVVHIDALTPVLPRRGTFDISGTVTNTSDTEFTRVNLHVISSSSPIDSAAALAESAATPADAFVGPRVADDGTFDTVEVLAPGETAPFAMSVPVELLHATGEPGVYWIGVQALGDTVLDGRLLGGVARTFIPALPRGDDSLEAAVILPLRSRVWYEADGRIAGTERWADWLAEGGRLDTALDVADAAAGHEHSWLVDPAILDALHRLTRFNPSRSLAPDPTVPGQEPSVPEPEEEPTDDATPSVSPTTSSQTLTPPAATGDGDDADEPTEEEVALAAAAQAWLERFAVSSTGRTVLALPFGDLDVSAAVRHRPQRYDDARDRSAQVMAELGIPAMPALAPENDVLSPEALLASPRRTTVLMGDTAFATPETRSSTVRLLKHRVVLTSTGAQSGGPAPTPADDPLAMRQRLLSEAALRVGAGSKAPVVLTLPRGWSAQDASALFAAFDETWLDPVSVTEVAARSATGVRSSALSYTEEDAEAELDAANFHAADRLAQSATLLEEVLALQTTVEQQVGDELLTTLSQQHRGRPRLAQRSAAAAREHIADQLASIRIEPIPRVVLSSDSGPLGATLVNGLDQPVDVAVVATSDSGMTLTGPGVRRLAPGARSRVTLNAEAQRPGVHNVRLAVTSESNVFLGSSARFPIRAAEVSGLIWVVMAAGAALLLSAAGLRVWRGLRGRDEAAASAPVEETPAERQHEVTA